VTATNTSISRRDLIKLGAAGALGLYLTDGALAGRLRSEAVTINWLTWSDHYANDQLAAVKKAMAKGAPAVLELMTARDWPHTGLQKTGWWDVPIPTYLPNKRMDYEKGRAEEKL